MIDSPSPSQPYDPAAWWAGVGGWYEGTCDPDVYRVQEDAIAAVLEPLEWDSVLDMGCGFGRLGMMIQRIRPEASYTGVDICQEMLESAKRHLPRGTFRKMSIQRYRPTELRKRDLVISAEVLMHQPENYHSFSLLLRRMVWLSNRWILNCDWDPQDGDPGNNWNIPHDYRALYGRNLVSATPAGIPDQTIFLAEVT